MTGNTLIMAIRKFRKQMKPIIWLVTILMVLGGGYATLSSIIGSMSNGHSNYAFKLNGNKISKFEVEKTKATMIDGYSRYLGDKVDRSLIDILAFDEVVNKNLTLEMADKLKVKVSNGDVNDQYDKIENSIGNRDQFKRMLQVQGYTKNTFKKELKDNLTVEQTLAKIQEGINPTDEEINKYYEDNLYTRFSGKPLSDVKNEVITDLKQTKGIEEYVLLLDKARKNMKLENVSQEYKAYVERNEMEEDGFAVSNIEMAKRTLNNLFITNGDRDKARELSKEYYRAQIKLAKIAIERGITVDETLPLDYKFEEYKKGLFENIKNSLNPTDAQLKEYFEKNKLVYDTFPSSDSYIAILKVDASAEDKAAAKAKAEELLKTLTPENFAEVAKKNSDGPSSPNGGDLGWFSKKDMVEPFQKAVFSGEVGKIYPQPVETIFGEHLIYIEDRKDDEERAKASHILIVPKVSEATINIKKAEIEAVKEKLANGTVNFETLSKENKDVLQSSLFSKIDDTGYIPGLGYNEALTKLIFDAPLNKVQTALIEDKFYIFKKTNEVKYKAADFNELKDRVKDDYLNSKTQEELKKLI
ncbi:peptidylprolyl isomerase [Fusobacterium ulcerans]|uniref:peptidylprolyl isomerase n=2 Tax=Fusobacterium ulcerans TaxID=861 RepID=UPI000E513AFA|nr:peptidylprolyl isomerase [Fusobacterium ulcerans]MCB8566371.1 peptidylprolyl isomerase [Fusobacterium ulcerans]MCB8650493.1 peptidylprolyl isomerase [Fusobacterium ulcerans]MEE0139995.1 peptidylprolyl isomerase [Fusobacterium ulcerans]RGY60546.1 peptidylprolyl isomerase [Fusobacterium ulcerans]HJH08092.1 peptidylprolyl isomerase [Fusobacterium ulcerans]